jgi:AraC-like DNA-binding protein
MGRQFGRQRARELPASEGNDPHCDDTGAVVEAAAITSTIGRGIKVSNGARMDARPLDAYPVARTADIDEMRAAVAQRYGANSLHLPRGPGGLFACLNHCGVRSIGLSFLSYGTDVVQDFPKFDAFAQSFWMRGSAETVVDGASVEVTPDQSPVVSPGARLTATYSADFEQCMLRIERTALISKFAALTGAPPRHGLKFAAAANLQTPESQHVRRLFMFLVDQLGSAECAIPPAALGELEQSVMVSFLCGNRHDHSHLLDRQLSGVAPWQVRRAEEYIEANWDQPITVEALAVATGASARSIFHYFKEGRGYSPMAFVKQVRLRHARRMLMTPEADTSVTSVAFACGFSNLGHFAKDYDKMFGELPSVTHNRAKGCRHRPVDEPVARYPVGLPSSRGFDLGARFAGSVAAGGG